LLSKSSHQGALSVALSTSLATSLYSPRSCGASSGVRRRGLTTPESNISRQRTVQCVPRKANRSVTSGTCHNCESNYAAFSPGAEGNSHAQDYLIRRCRRVGPDWCWNVVWRQNIYCHRRTGWLSRQATRNDDWCKGSAYLAL